MWSRVGFLESSFSNYLLKAQDWCIMPHTIAMHHFFVAIVRIATHHSASHRFTSIDLTYAHESLFEFWLQNRYDERTIDAVRDIFDFF